MGVAEKQRVVGLEIRVQQHVQQAALARSYQVRDAGNRLLRKSPAANYSTPARSFRHQLCAIRQEGEAPWVLQAFCHGFELETPGVVIKGLCVVCANCGSNKTQGQSQ